MQWPLSPPSLTSPPSLFATRITAHDAVLVQHEWGVQCWWLHSRAHAQEEKVKWLLNTCLDDCWVHFFLHFLTLQDYWLHFDCHLKRLTASTALHCCCTIATKSDQNQVHDKQTLSTWEVSRNKQLAADFWKWLMIRFCSCGSMSSSSSSFRPKEQKCCTSNTPCIWEKKEKNKKSATRDTGGRKLE